MLAGTEWLTPLWTTVAGGVIVVLCQQTYRWVGRWQESRRDVDDRDHKLLQEVADVLMDKPSGVFSKSSPGMVTRFGALEGQVSHLGEKVEEIAVAVGQLLERTK